MDSWRKFELSGHKPYIRTGLSGGGFPQTPGTLISRSNLEEFLLLATSSSCSSKPVSDRYLSENLERIRLSTFAERRVTSDEFCRIHTCLRVRLTVSYFSAKLLDSILEPCFLFFFERLTSPLLEELQALLLPRLLLGHQCDRSRGSSPRYQAEPTKWPILLLRDS